MSFGKQSSASSSRPLRWDEIQSYFDAINKNSGGKLKYWAKEGTPQTDLDRTTYLQTPFKAAQFSTAPYKAGSYDPAQFHSGNYTGAKYTGADYTGAGFTGVTPEQIKSLGGMGATRLSDIDRARTRAREEHAADPTLSVYQKYRANQLTDEDLNARADAIRKETEAAIGALTASEAARKTGFDVGEAARATDFSQGEAARATDFSQGEAARKTGFDVGEADRATLFDLTESGRATDFSTEEAARLSDYYQTEAARKTGFSQDEADRYTQHTFADRQGLVEHMQEENMNKYLTEKANNERMMEDMKILANIFFGGAGNVTTSAGQGLNFGFG